MPSSFRRNHQSATLALTLSPYDDPTLGRFTQPDPTEQDEHYTYAGNSPSNYIDPDGDAFFIPLAILALRLAPLAIRGTTAAGARGARFSGAIYKSRDVAVKTAKRYANKHKKLQVQR